VRGDAGRRPVTVAPEDAPVEDLPLVAHGAHYGVPGPARKGRDACPD
jgi:hypothetical protein